MHGGESDAFRLRCVDSAGFECDVRQIMLSQRIRDGVALPSRAGDDTDAPQ